MYLSFNHIILGVYLYYERQKCINQSFLLIKRAKNDQFEKTQGDLESIFYWLFDGYFKFEELSLVKHLFPKNSRKRG